MNKSILYIVSARSFSSANPGRKIYEVIEVWKRLGINVYSQFGKDIISKTINDSSYGNQQFHNSTLRKKNYLNFLINSYSELKDIIHDRKLYSKIKNEYKKEHLNIVWERSSRLHWSGLRLARFKKVPFVLEWKDHLVDYKYSLFKQLALYIENKKLRYANYIIVESNVLKQQLIMKNIQESKIKVALNAVNPNEFKKSIEQGLEIRKELNISSNKSIVGYLGSYAFYHNSLLLIEAAKTILEIRNDIQFLLIGNGQDFRKCYDLGKKYNLIDNGIIMKEGVAKEIVPQLLSVMDITVLPGSTDIICPIKIMEYMASETIVIAPDYLCNQEIISDSINGYLFTPNNTVALSNTIQKAVDNIDESKKIQTAAREHVSRNLVWEKTWGKVLLDILADEKVNKD